MGMSTHVEGIIPADEKYMKMAKIYNDCEDLGVVPPEEVIDFFEGDRPDPTGMSVSLGDAASEYGADMQEGYEVDVRKLDPRVKIIRFTNSY